MTSDARSDGESSRQGSGLVVKLGKGAAFWGVFLTPSIDNSLPGCLEAGIWAIEGDMARVTIVSKLREILETSKTIIENKFRGVESASQSTSGAMFFLPFLYLPHSHWIIGGIYIKGGLADIFQLMERLIWVSTEDLVAGVSGGTNLSEGS